MASTLSNFKIFLFHLCHSKENRLYPFVSLLLSFVSRRIRRRSAFQFLRDLCKTNLANFQDIEMGPTAFEGESFVPLLLSFVPQRVRRYIDFKILKMRQEGKLVIFEDIEMGPMAFERESFVFVCISPFAVGFILISLKMIDFPSWRIYEILKSLYLRTL